MTIHIDTYEGLRQYLQAMLDMRKMNIKQPDEFAYFGMEYFLLQHGQEYKYAPLPEDVEQGAPKQCFSNAYKLARKRKWLYVEGIATSVIPLQHAWVINPAEPNVVIDPTWDNHYVADSLKGITRIYIGVPFNLKVVGKALKCEVSMLDDWKNDFPLYTGKLTEVEWRA